MGRSELKNSGAVFQILEVLLRGDDVYTLLGGFVVIEC